MPFGTVEDLAGGTNVMSRLAAGNRAPAPVSGPLRASAWPSWARRYARLLPSATPAPPRSQFHRAAPFGRATTCAGNNPASFLTGSQAEGRGFEPRVPLEEIATARNAPDHSGPCDWRTALEAGCVAAST
jgi:hypothetical protein